MIKEKIISNLEIYAETYNKATEFWENVRNQIMREYKEDFQADRLSSAKDVYEKTLSDARNEIMSSIDDVLDSVKSKVVSVTEKEIPEAFKSTLNIIKNLEKPTKSEVESISGMYFNNYLCYRSFWFLLMGIPAGIWYIRWKKKEKIDKRKKRIAYHFQDVLHGLQTAVRAGYAMERAVTECRKELEQIYGTEDELVKELVYMERQMKVGVGVDQLFLDLGLRTGVEDILNFGEIFMISRKSGGNLGDIMEKMARIIGEKIRVSREIDVAIAGKKMEQLIMSLVPGGMILYMQASSRGFMDVLYHNPAGVCVMTICLCVYGCSFYMGRKIVRIAI